MQSVIFFDGVCNLCNGMVQFVIERDQKQCFKFASLQSEYAKATLPAQYLDLSMQGTFILMEGGTIYTRSTAALHVAKKLGGVWSLLYGFIIVPKFIRDGLYNYVGKNRYKWFGKQESCWLPTPELRSRFLS
jgi:predicted DCC family thiol-disulfide oxidoreductase YuxK